MKIPYLLGFDGGPGRSPTCDLRVRSALLYATELPGHVISSVSRRIHVGVMERVIESHRVRGKI